jgi:predicted nucleic-acid-binding protein
VITIDTNVLIRYIVRDDPVQAERARRLLQEQLTAEQPGLITVAAVAELCWVLRRGYRRSQEEVKSIVLELMQVEQLVFERAEAIEAALALPHQGVVDSIIHEIGMLLGSEKTVTFDRKFARLDGVELLKAG